MIGSSPTSDSMWMPANTATSPTSTTVTSASTMVARRNRASPSRILPVRKPSATPVSTQMTPEPR